MVGGYGRERRGCVENGHGRWRVQELRRRKRTEEGSGRGIGSGEDDLEWEREVYEQGRESGGRGVGNWKQMAMGWKWREEDWREGVLEGR